MYSYVLAIGIIDWIIIAIYEEHVFLAVEKCCYEGENIVKVMRK